MFKEVPNKINFPQMEEAILAQWEAKDIFRRSIAERTGAPDWVFYDGPPGTNGRPHVGHMMQSALKDAFGRYKTMRGFRVLRKAGWDTHGLPVELTAEKELKLKSKRDIEKFGVDNYIDYCRKTVFRYKREWEEAILRLGRFLDLKNDYATLSKSYIQSDWWTIKSIWQPSAEMRAELGISPEESLLYKSYRISPYCPRCGTTLSNFETAQGYMDTVDFALYPKFRAVDDAELFYIAWTTTAWTLLSNVALALGPHIDYLIIKLKTGEKLVVAEARLGDIARIVKEYEILSRQKGSDFQGRHYLPLWDFLAQPNTNAHQIIIDNYVSVTEGTGIVHLAAYGEDDFRIIRNHHLPFIQNVDEDGICQGGQYTGRYFKDDDLDVEIIKDLAQRGLLLHKEKHEHSYPFCFRCDSALMYFPRASWFIRTSRIKDKMTQANQTINWFPEHIKEGRFGNWLENNVDWNITRERYWGSPLPIWTCAKCDTHQVVASIAELNELYYQSCGKNLPSDFDPHKPQIDVIELKCDCGGVMRRENFVLDSWFNAGIMPWGQFGFPAEPGSREILAKQFPGDFICEAIDQTRGWFYTMLAAAVLVKGVSSFKNVICTELILDERGQKMSKSKGNVVHPLEVINKFGADPFRWAFFNTHPWTVKLFSDEVIVDCLRKVSIPLWNAYSFLVTYANIDGWNPPALMKPATSNPLDRWIVSEFQSLNTTVTTSMDNYDIASSAKAIEDYLDLLTNWYIRRSRRRFWKSENDSDKQDAYKTLHYVITELSKLLAPFMPFLADEIYLNLAQKLTQRKDSVHLEDYPLIHLEWRDKALEQRMNIVREAVNLGRSLRNDHKVKTRQPLSELKIIASQIADVADMVSVIADELNVKKVTFLEQEAGLVQRKVKPNFRALGAKFGSRMKEVQAEIANLTDAQIETFLSKGKIILAGEEVSGEELLVEESAGEGMAFRRGTSLAIILNLLLTEELRMEGLVREFISKVQNHRKECNYNLTDRIACDCMTASPELINALTVHKEHILNEILGTSLRFIDPKDDYYSKFAKESVEFRINDISIRIKTTLDKP